MIKFNFNNPNKNSRIYSSDAYNFCIRNHWFIFRFKNGCRNKFIKIGLRDYLGIPPINERISHGR